MPIATPPVLTDPGLSPDRADRATFSARAIALDDFTKNVQIPQLRLALTNVAANATDAATSGTNAANSATSSANSATNATNQVTLAINQVTLATAEKTAAALSAQTAAQSAALPGWVSGTNYTAGQRAISLTNGRPYMSLTAGVSTTDPATDTARWQLITSNRPIVAVTGTSITATAGNHYVMTNAALSTLTLPALPATGMQVEITFANNRIDNIVARNGSGLLVNDLGAPILEDMVFDAPSVRITLEYAGNAWRFLVDAAIVAEFPTAALNAATALTQAGIATTQAGLAQTAKTQAESARDAAIIGAGVYTTEALGRAAVADGVAFKVQGTGDVAALEYRRTNSTTSALIASYPSSTAVTNLGQASIFVPTANALLLPIKKLQLYGANVTKFYWVRYFFKDDSGIRFNCTIQQLDDAAGTGAIDVASFVSAGATYTGRQEFTMTALGGSGITGTLVVDFSQAAAVFAIYAGSAATLMRADTAASSAALTASQQAVATGIVNANASLTSGLKLPFVDTLSNDFLRSFVKDIFVYGADPAHVYILSQVEIQTFRCSFTLRNITTGVDVARAVVTATISNYNTLQPVWKLARSTLGVGWGGIYAVMRLDWAKAITGTYNYTLATQSGISSTKLRSDEMVSDYLSRDVWHEVIKVGSGRTFATLRAAVESLYEAGSQICARSCYDYQILIDLVDEGTYNATFLAIPEFVSIRGLGVDKTFIAKESNVEDALIEAHFETKFIGLTIISDTGNGSTWLGEYAIHSDDFNKVSLGGVDQVRRLRQSFRRLKLTGGANQNAWIFGCGTSSGQHIRFEDVIAEHRKTDSALPAFGFHNVGPTISVPGIPLSAKPSLVELIGCRSPDATAASVYVQSLGGGNKSRLVLTDCQFGLIQQAVATGELDTDRAADRYEWEYGGVYDGAVIQADADMLVLTTTAGQVPSGTAAALIFGVTDELGRGDKWIKTGTTKSLGARLGDCSVTNKLLTIGVQTCTFNTNLTAATNADVITLINAAITTNPVSEKNIQYEIYPDLGYTRRMLNNSGAAILAGRFVKRISANAIALATGDDDVFGFVFRDILNGLSGAVVVSKNIHAAYITGAAGNGKFGVTAGLLDYGAAIKKGFVNSSILTRY